MNLNLCKYLDKLNQFCSLSILVSSLLLSTLLQGKERKALDNYSRKITIIPKTKGSFESSSW